MRFLPVLGFNLTCLIGMGSAGRQHWAAHSHQPHPTAALPSTLLAPCTLRASRNSQRWQAGMPEPSSGNVFKWSVSLGSGRVTNKCFTAGTAPERLAPIPSEDTACLCPLRRMPDIAVSLFLFHLGQARTSWSGPFFSGPTCCAYGGHWSEREHLLLSINCVAYAAYIAPNQYPAAWPLQ